MRRKRAFYDNPGIKRAAVRKEQLLGKVAHEPEKPRPVGDESPSAVVAPVKTGRLGTQVTVAIVLLGLVSILPILRLTGVVRWSLALVILPLAICGAFFLAVFSLNAFASRFSFLRQLLFARQGEAGTVTPPPERLEPPLSADGIGENILVEHPELLAALCLGFRRKQFVPDIFGKPVSDAWGVYSAALIASSLQLEQLHAIARMHLTNYAKHPKFKRRTAKKMSESELMHSAVDHFRTCAEKTAAKGGNPDCPYEHVVVAFGARVPSRDAQLRSIAPRIRSLLEHQYPQIRTTNVAGLDVKFSDWQKQAVRDKQELDHEKKERQRAERKLSELRTELQASHDELAGLTASVEQARNEARTAARSEQARTVADLHETIERSTLEHNRGAQRLQSEMQKLTLQLNALTAERDQLETLLFPEAEEGEETAADTQLLAGLRVLLVGGDAKQAGPVREHAQSVGIQMLHEDSVNAVQLVEGVDLVVFWIRYLSHPKYFAVRRECRVSGTQHCYWMRTSPEGLVNLIARARTGSATLTG